MLVAYVKLFLHKKKQYFAAS